MKVVIFLKDYCLRAVAADGKIRAFVASSKHLVNYAAKIHGTSPVVSAALGRLLTATAIMGLMAGNEDDLITVNIKADGPIGGVLATADGFGRVKGYAQNPIVIIDNKPDGKLNVGGAVGSGFITVMKDLGLKEPYVGRLTLVSGEIAEDITNYFAASEQTPTVLSLGVLVDVDYSVKAAGGFLIQLMPGAEEELVLGLESKMADFPSISGLFDEDKSPEDVLDLLLADFNYTITAKADLEYYCNCNKKRVTAALISLGTEQLNQIINEDGKAEIKCHFCNKNYFFDKEALLNILNESIV